MDLYSFLAGFLGGMASILVSALILAAYGQRTRR